MNADFSRHKATFLLYPSRKDVWRKQALPIRESIVGLANVISRFERVYLGYDVAVTQRVESGVVLEKMQYNDVWTRDTGLIRVKEKGVLFRFNAWGGELYSDWSKDLTVAPRMAEILGVPYVESELTLEGGNLASDGRGTLISVKPTVCGDNRNPGFSQSQIEELLKTALDVQNIVWLPTGLKYDETGGHVDNLCAFADEKTVFLAWTDDKDNPQYDVVHTAYDVLSVATNTDGRRYDIAKIPLPDIFTRTDDDCDGLENTGSGKERPYGEPIQPSYINFVFVNGGVIVPQFGDRNDLRVYEIFKNFFSDRSVLPFDSREVVLGGGGIHCLTKNF